MQSLPHCVNVALYWCQSSAAVTPDVPQLCGTQEEEHEQYKTTITVLVKIAAQVRKVCVASPAMHLTQFTRFLHTQLQYPNCMRQPPQRMSSAGKDAQNHTTPSRLLSFNSCCPQDTTCSAARVTVLQPYRLPPAAVAVAAAAAAASASAAAFKALQIGLCSGQCLFWHSLLQ